MGFKFFNKKSPVVKAWGTEIYYDTLTKEDREQFLKDLPTLEEESLTISDCEGFRYDCCCASIPTFYLNKIMRPLSENFHLQKLSLDASFLTYFDQTYILMNGLADRHIHYADLNCLAKMKNLKTLVLEIPGVNGHSKINFKSLSELLTNSSCSIEHLELIGDRGLSNEEVGELVTTLSNASNLKSYRGVLEDNPIVIAAMQSHQAAASFEI